MNVRIKGNQHLNRNTLITNVMIFLIEPPLSPSYKKEAVRYLIDHIPAETLEEIAVIIKKEGSDWGVSHHYDIGIDVRNLLRNGEFLWDAVELDDVWIELIEKAVKKKSCK